jgi:hypothetical protein
MALIGFRSTVRLRVCRNRLIVLVLASPVSGWSVTGVLDGTGMKGLWVWAAVLIGGQADIERYVGCLSTTACSEQPYA